MMVLLLPDAVADSVVDGTVGVIDFAEPWHNGAIDVRVHIAVPHRNRPGVVIGTVEIAAYVPDGPPARLYFVEPRRVFPRIIPRVQENTPMGFHEVPDFEPATPHATRYVYFPESAFAPDDGTSIHLRPRSGDAVTVEWRGFDRWAIVDGGSYVWNETANEWRYEASPSNRSDEFIAQTRYSLEDAHRIAHRIVNGAPL